jgi:hypothetical protein
MNLFPLRKTLGHRGRFEAALQPQSKRRIADRSSHIGSRSCDGERSEDRHRAANAAGITIYPMLGLEMANVTADGDTRMPTVNIFRLALFNSVSVFP